MKAVAISMECSTCSQRGRPENDFQFEKSVSEYVELDLMHWEVPNRNISCQTDMCELAFGVDPRLARHNERLLKEVERLQEELSQTQTENVVLKDNWEKQYLKYEFDFRQERRKCMELQTSCEKLQREIDEMKLSWTNQKGALYKSENQVREYEMMLKKYHPVELERRQMKNMELEQQRREQAVKDTEQDIISLEKQLRIWASRQSFYNKLASARKLCGAYHPRTGDSICVLSIHVERDRELWEHYNHTHVTKCMTILDQALAEIASRERFRLCCSELPKGKNGDAYCFLVDSAMNCIEFSSTLQEELPQKDYPKQLRGTPPTQQVIGEGTPTVTLFNGPRLCMGIEQTIFYQYQEEECRFLGESIQERAHGGEILVTREIYNEISHIVTFSPPILIQEHASSHLIRIVPQSMRQRLKFIPPRVRQEAEDRPEINDLIEEMEDSLETKREQLKIRQSLVLKLYRELEDRCNAQEEKMFSLQHALESLNDELEDKTTVLREKIQYEEIFWQEKQSLSELNFLPSFDGKEEFDQVISEAEGRSLPQKIRSPQENGHVSHSQAQWHESLKIMEQLESKTRELDILHTKLKVLQEHATEILLTQNTEALQGFLDKYSQTESERVRLKSQVLEAHLIAAKEEISRISAHSCKSHSELLGQKMQLEEQADQLRVHLKELESANYMLTHRVDVLEEQLQDARATLNDSQGGLSRIEQELLHHRAKEPTPISGARVAWQPNALLHEFVIADNCQSARHVNGFTFSTVLGNTCWTSGKIKFTVHLNKITDNVYVGIAPFSHESSVRVGDTRESWAISCNSSKLLHSSHFFKYREKDHSSARIRAKVTVLLDLDEKLLSFACDDGIEGSPVALDFPLGLPMTPAVSLYHKGDCISIS